MRLLCLLAGELRFAVLDTGGESLHVVVGTSERLAECLLILQGLLKRHLKGGVENFPSPFHPERGVLGESISQRTSAFIDFFGATDLIDEIDPLCLLGFNELSREDQLLGLCQTN
jgi:hypothetical protein